MTGLGIGRDQIRAEFLALLPDVIEQFGQLAVISTEPQISPKVLLETLKPGIVHIGEINRRATHQVTLLWLSDFPKRGGFSVMVDGRAYVPVGETVNAEEFDIVLTVPLVERDVFYPDHATRQDGPSIQLRIVARGALPFMPGSGLQDVQGAPVSSHLGFIEPGVKLHGGDVLTIASGDKFTVVPPLQHDLLGDTVGLSWQGDQTVPNLTPDPTPDAPGKPDAAPGDDSYWHT